jgi:hypothetical protein
MLYLGMLGREIKKVFDPFVPESLEKNEPRFKLLEGANEQHVAWYLPFGVFLDTTFGENPPEIIPIQVSYRIDEATKKILPYQGMGSLRTVFKNTVKEVLNILSSQLLRLAPFDSEKPGTSS